MVLCPPLRRSVKMPCRRPARWTLSTGIRMNFHPELALKECSAVWWVSQRMYTDSKQAQVSVLHLCTSDINFQTAILIHLGTVNYQKATGTGAALRKQSVNLKEVSLYLRWMRCLRAVAEKRKKAKWKRMFLSRKFHLGYRWNVQTVREQSKLKVCSGSTQLFSIYLSLFITVEKLCYMWYQYSGFKLKFAGILQQLS